ncbi:MAG: hypothetical protein AAF993_09085 [Pseudomonadota bacterium]
MNGFPVWRSAAIVLVQGSNAAEFLQGYLTCATERLADDALTPMAICNVKGRVIASGWAFHWAAEEAVALVVHESLADTISQFLSPYARFSRCNLVAADAQLRLLDNTLPAPSDKQVLQTSGPALAEHHFVVDSSQGAEDADDCSALLDAGLVDASYAFISEASSAEYLPQMLGLDKAGAVDFDKGCYLGQEIVARAQFRGAVKKQLVQFAAEADADPVIGQAYADHIKVVSYAAQSGCGLAVSAL